MRDIDLVMEIIKELELRSKNINVRTGKGYGVGHPYDSNRIKPGYGIINPVEDEKDLEQEEEEIIISKAFKSKKE